MEWLDSVLEIFDSMLDTKLKRHTVGGALLSVSLLFGGLAFTVITIKEDDESYGRKF